MDRFRREWSRDTEGWWRPCVNEEQRSKSRAGYLGHFKVKVTDEGNAKLLDQSDGNSKLPLLDVLQDVVRVKSRGSGNAMMMKFMKVLGTVYDPVPSLEYLHISFTDLSFIMPVLDAIKSKKLPKLKSFSLWSINLSNDEDGELLAGVIASGDLLSLTVLHLHTIELRGGHFTLAKAMESGKLLTLESLHLFATSMGDDGCKAYTTAVSSGNLPSLLVIDFRRNQIGNRGATFLGNAIRSGELKNVAQLSLKDNEIADEGLIALADAFQVGTTSVLPNMRKLDLSNNKFTEQSLQRLAEALELGCLDSLDMLGLNNDSYSEKAAEAFVSAMAKKKYLVVNIYVPAYHTTLYRRKQQLLKRNSRNKELLLGMGVAASVSAAFSKVYLCGHPEVGKTTFRHTLETVQMSRLEALTKRKSYVEGRTRGIEVSPILSKGNKSSENPTTLLVWDLAGQEDYHLLHNAFFQDWGAAEGKATTFVIVCSLKSVKNNLEESQKQLVYWLRFIASSCNKNTRNPRHVLIVLNNFLRNLNVGAIQSHWQHVLEDQREKFAGRLDIQTNPFIRDVREPSLVKDINKCLLEHSRNSLRDEKVPKICQFIQENLSIWSESRQHFPVLQWEDFMTLVRSSSSEQWSEETLEGATKYWNGELWPEKTLDAATKYLHEAGVLIFIDRRFPSDWGIPGRKLVVLSPNWFCSQAVGNMYLQQDMGFPAERLFRKKVDKEIGLFRMKVDRRTGSISEEAFKKFFKSSLKLGGEWSETELEDLIAILLSFGLCYKGRNLDLFIPSLIDEIGTPEDRWGRCNSQELDHWVLGFSVEHHKNELTLAPIALWHRFQVELAQTPKYNDRPDNDFVCGRYSVTFSIDFMKVLIRVNVNKASPTFYDVNIFVKPLQHVHDSDGKQRKQLQVDLAGDLVDLLLGLWEQVCPGVEYLQRVVWPWPASLPGLHVMPDRNLDVEEAKELVQKHGLGWTMQWEVGTSGAITVDQLLSTKDKDGVMKNYLCIVRKGVAEAVELRIFPHDTLNGERYSKESTLLSHDAEEENQPISPSSKLVLKKLDKIDKKLDQNDDKLNKRLDNMESLIRDGFKKQRELLQKIHNTGQFFRQDRERACPRFIYLGEQNSGTWVALKDALSPSVTFRLQFACEAQYNDYKLHKVKNQQGIDVSKLRGWVGKIAPWLKVSLIVLLICAKIGANFVAPGLGLILPDFGQSTKVSSLSQGLAWATGFTKDELDKHMMQSLGLDANTANWDPREVYGKSREAIAKFLEQELTPKAYEEKLRLRKVCLRHPESSLEEITWICPECYEKYKMSSISIREL